MRPYIRVGGAVTGGNLTLSPVLNLIFLGAFLSLEVPPFAVFLVCSYGMKVLDDLM